MPSITVNRTSDPPSPVTHSDAPTAEPVAIELCQLQRDLLRAISSNADKESVLSSISVLLNSAIHPIVMQHFVRDDKKQLAFSWQQLS
ncbi:MAG: hypothetical protein V3V75_11425, partial [Thermoguttaceae bacterium]